MVWNLTPKENKRRAKKKKKEGKRGYIESEMLGESDGAGAMAVESPQPLEWKFSQVFGERSAGEDVQEGLFFFFFSSSYFEIKDLIFIRTDRYSPRNH